MKLIYDGPMEAVTVLGVGRVAQGQEFEVEDARGEELLAKVRQGFRLVENDPADLTVAQLKARLTEAGIAFDANAKKADLAALLAEAGKGD